MIGRKTVKGGKTSAPLVKAAPSKTGRGRAASASSVNGDPTHEAIAVRSYELYLPRGAVDGYHEQDWLQAEAELSSR